MSRRDSIHMKAENRPGLAPSPNWYLPSISSCNDDGWLAFGARNEIFLMDLKTQWINRRLRGHEGRITSTCFLNGSLPLLASSSSDKSVIIWNYETGAVVEKYREHKVRWWNWEKCSLNALTQTVSGIRSLGFKSAWILAQTVHKELRIT